MAELKEFKLPDIGEGLTEADILRWEVKVGDPVVVNQVLCEVETAKAAVELPSPYAGVVRAIHFEEGVTVDVGRPIVSIEVGAGATSPPDETAAPSPGGVSPAPVAVASAPADEPPAERQAVLVGYGVSGERGRRRKRSSAAEASAAPGTNQAFAIDPAPAPVQPAPEPAARITSVPSGVSVLAKPPVRKLAKDLGVDLSVVTPTGPNGTVSREDVETAARAGESESSPGWTFYTPEQDARQERDRLAREERIPIKGVRKHTAAAMVSSAFTAPHVTEFVTVDVTATMELRDRVAARREFRDIKVSPLLFVARALLWATRRTPIINSTWDEPAGEIVVKQYVNLGIAAATDRGLIVPNIKDSDQLSLLGLAQALATLTDTARAGKTTPADMSNGTITITNVGVFGVDTGTPILNPGEAAILAVGAIRRQPWVVGTGSDERIEPRWVTQLAVSFDHRSVDGQQGSQFLADVAAVLNDPGLALL